MQILPDDRLVRHVQARLIALGFDPGGVDGLAWERTLASLDRALPPRNRPATPPRRLSDAAFVAHLRGRLTELGHYHGPVDGDEARAAIVASLNTALPTAPARVLEGVTPPWVAVGLETLGWHEIRDNARLRAWLKRDGRTLGDPDSLPWCGDWQETCQRIALPDEAFPGPLGENPYWALNWLHYGRRLQEPGVGAVGVKRRKGGGHVFTALDADATHVYALGGNQSDAVTIARIRLSEVEGWRWPKSWPGEPRPFPREMRPGRVPLAASEA